MSKIFDSIAVKSTPESVFDMSHEVKLSGNMGELIPIFLEEVIPGDTFQVKSEIMIRLAPMLAPVMHRVNVYTHYFYVPNRLVWDSWNDHITGGEDGTANPAFPTFQINDSNKGFFVKGSLADYLGVPIIEDQATPITATQEISALPFRAYQTIYNEYYRDQDLSAKVQVDKSDGASTAYTPHLSLRTRHWQRDYFTSARPTSQKGAQVLLPIAGSFTPQYKVNDGSPDFNIVQELDGNGNVVGPAGAGPLSSNGSNLAVNDGTLKNASLENLKDPQIINNVSTSVEDQRRANRLQEWLELAQRGGSRINEIIRNFFGVVPDDLRLSRPQYLGGGMQNVTMSEVLNTAGDTGSTLQPLGEYGGHGISYGNQNGFRERFKEHGYVIGILSVIPKTAYQQGLSRHWTKFDKYERYWPQFANIGEQEILQKEIFWDPITADNPNEQTFGYAPRYAEYKYACDRVAGDFRKEVAADNLSYWHMGRYFETAPALNEDFVKSDPTHRIFAVTDESVDKLYVQIYHKFKAKRKMPYHNIPSIAG